MLCKWNNIVCGLLWLVSFTYHNALDILPYGCIRSFFLFIVKYNSIVWVYYNLFVQLSFWGFAELLESVGWNLSSIWNILGDCFSNIISAPISVSPLLWDLSCSYATAFGGVPLFLMLRSILSILFLCVSLDDCFYFSYTAFFTIVSIYDVIAMGSCKWTWNSIPLLLLGYLFVIT